MSLSALSCVLRKAPYRACSVDWKAKRILLSSARASEVAVLDVSCGDIARSVTSGALCMRGKGRVVTVEDVEDSETCLSIDGADGVGDND